MQGITVVILSFIGHRENTREENEENVEKVNESFVTMKRNLGI